METRPTRALAESAPAEPRPTIDASSTPTKRTKRIKRSWRRTRPGSDRIVNALATVPLFAACRPRELAQVSRIGTLVTVVAGTDVTKQGRPGSEFLVVIDGYAGCSVDGREVKTLGPGDFFGEVALLNGGPRCATVTAKTDMELLDLDRREFYGMLDSVPAVTRKLLTIMAGYPMAAAP